MKRIYFFTSLLMCLLAAGYCCAKDTAGKSRDQLQFSLLSLKDQARSIEQKNIWLEKEIRLLEKNLEGLKNDYRELSREIVVREKDAGENKQEAVLSPKEILLNEKKTERLRKNAIALNKEVMRLEAEFIRKKKDNEKLTKEFMAQKEKVESARQKLAGLQQASYDHQKEELTTSLQESESRVGDLEENLQRVTKEYQRPLKKIEDLKKQNSLLKQQVAITRDEYELLLRTEEGVKKDFYAFEDKKQKRILELTEKIASYKEKQGQLEKTLKQARKKLENKNIEIKDAGEKKDLERLRKTLEQMQEEKASLTGHIKALETDLADLKK